MKLKLISLSLIGLAALFFIPSADDLVLNIPIALIVASLLQTSFLVGYLITYTVIPVTLIVIALELYPDNQIKVSEIINKIGGN